jgi:uncharacterized membrane protein
MIDLLLLILLLILLLLLLYFFESTKNHKVNKQTKIEKTKHAHNKINKKWTQ